MKTINGHAIFFFFGGGGGGGGEEKKMNYGLCESGK